MAKRKYRKNRNSAGTWLFIILAVIIVTLTPRPREICMGWGIALFVAALVQNRVEHVRRSRGQRRRWARAHREQRRKSKEIYVPTVDVDRVSLARAKSIKRDLTPLGFEKYVGALLRRAGFDVEHAGRSGDGGIDLWIQLNGKRGIVQCKLYDHERKVGSPAVRNLHGAMAREGVARAFLVTNTTFTRPAIEEAAIAGIHLFDGKKLEDLERRFGIVENTFPSPFDE